MKKLLVVMAVVGMAFAGQASAWTNCSGNGGVCNNKGPNNFRFGYEGNWVYASGKGSVDCVPANFQVYTSIEGDPFGPGIPEVDKRCEKEQ